MTYTEKDFESHIESELLNSGFKSRTTQSYDKTLCIIPEDVIGFIKDTQLKQYEKLENQDPFQTESRLIKRIASEIQRRGIIEVLRQGVEDRGSKFQLTFFEPKSGLNPEHKERYSQNRFTLIRQLKYSEKNENSLDMALFVNGIPISTLELKNTLTGQGHLDAEVQYKKDRDPNEPLFKFKRCLVHFAVGNEKVSMTTRLSGNQTKFLPYNKGIENPVNPNGHKTSYLWENILQPNSILDLIENFVHIRDESEKEFDPKQGKIIEKKSQLLVFPRYHQIEVIRKLKKAIISEGVGNNYLIEHTTGSGKSLSIGWLSHLLSSLYQNPTDTGRMFDSVIVITDRRVLDKQIQNTIKQLEQTKGVVNPVDINSQQLRQFLEEGKSIIISTVQKFKVISKSISELKSKHFAVVIDEVHSSQSGESAKHLKRSLSQRVLNEFHEGEDVEDLTEADEMILDEMIARGRQKHISFFGFSGTPKGKTLEIFGRKNEYGGKEAFDKYTMQQSIAEGFTLDTLKNYTNYKRFFKLNTESSEDYELPSGQARRMLVNWVDLHPHSIQEKTRIVLEHFKEHTSHKISGRSRGMLVTRSRLHCVKYKLEFDKQMKEMGLGYGCLVGFSGTVSDRDMGEDYTESSMNGFSENETRDQIKDPRYRILIVNNKFQTGFDEPLLHTMYIDKKLGGLQCVQTLSRLNRSMTGKTDTFVLDFVNEPTEIQEAFQQYYKGTILTEETDPNRLYDLKNEIRKHNIYQDDTVSGFTDILFGEESPNESLQPILDKVVEQWSELEEPDREDFRNSTKGFLRLYGYVSQVISFTDISLEKEYIFLQNLLKKLPRKSKQDITDIVSDVNLDSFNIQKRYDNTSIALEDVVGELEPVLGEVGSTQPDEPQDLLSNIINGLNEIYGSDLTDEHRVNLERIQQRLNENEQLQKVFSGNNSDANKQHVFKGVFENVLQEFFKENTEFYNKMIEPERNKYLTNRFYEIYANTQTA